MRASGGTIFNMVMEQKPLRTAQNTKVSSSRVRKMEMVFIIGKMGPNTSENGMTIRYMGKENTHGKKEDLTMENGQITN